MSDMMLESVAKACCEAGNHAPWPETNGYTDRDEKRAWFKIARAAIEAMREPTEQMCLAASDAIGVWGFGASDFLIAFNAAIDAALQPATDSEAK